MEMFKNRRVLLIAALVLFVTGAGGVVTSSFARGQILDNALVHEKEGSIILEIELTMPFRYQSHFPADSGKELRITIDPIRVAAPDLGAALQRESLVPPNADLAAIDEIIYEGDTPGGASVTIRFTQPMRFEVIQSGNTRKLSITIQEIN